MEVQSLEEWIEQERNRLSSANLTPITESSFNQWKEKRLRSLAEQEAQTHLERESAIKAGRQVNASGRELFEYRPELLLLEEEGDEVFDFGDLRAFHDAESSLNAVDGDGNSDSATGRFDENDDVRNNQ